MKPLLAIASFCMLVPLAACGSQTAGDAASSPTTSAAEELTATEVDSRKAQANSQVILVDKAGLKDVGSPAKKASVKSYGPDKWKAWTIKTHTTSPRSCLLPSQLAGAVVPYQVTTAGTVTGIAAESGDTGLYQYLVTRTDGEELDQQLSTSLSACNTYRWRSSSGWRIGDRELVDSGRSVYSNKVQTATGDFQWSSKANYTEHDCDKADEVNDCAFQNTSSRTTFVTVRNDVILVTSANYSAQNLVLPTHRSAVERLEEMAASSSSS